MRKSEFINKAVNILYSVMVQCTIAIENYTNVTRSAFNLKVLEYYREWCEKYDETRKTFSEKGLSDNLCDAVLIKYLRSIKENEVKRTLSYIEKNIIKMSGVDYNITERYIKYEESKEIDNPFERIILDIRILEDQKTQREMENHKGKEGPVMEEIVWFSEEELEIMRQTQKNRKIYDGELGGHISYNKVSDDLSYLLSKQERQEIFEQCVYGVVHNAE